MTTTWTGVVGELSGHPIRSREAPVALAGDIEAIYNQALTTSQYSISFGGAPRVVRGQRFFKYLGLFHHQPHAFALFSTQPRLTGNID